MNHTTYYQLSLWEQDDRIMREDFNDNNAKLDTAVKAANDRIDTKANAAALGAETTARENADTALGSRIDSEAQARQNADTALQNAIDTETAVRTAAVNAINANLGSHGHNCRIASGSYVGTGAYGADNPSSLTFDFYPLLVMIYLGQPRDIYYPAPLTFMRPRTTARQDNMNGAFGSQGYMTVSWGEDSVSWYCDGVGDYQNNATGKTYYYVVSGYDKDAEAV